MRTKLEPQTPRGRKPCKGRSRAFGPLFAAAYGQFESQAALPGMQLTLPRERFNAHLKAFMEREYDQPGIDMERFTKQAPYRVRKADLPQLRSLRRERAERVSNEAWDEVAFLTLLMQYAKTARN